MIYNLITIIFFIVTTFFSLKISLSLSFQKDKRLIFTPILLFTLLQSFMVNIGLLMLVNYEQKHYLSFIYILLCTLFFNLGAFLINKRVYDFTLSNVNESSHNKIIIMGGYILTCLIIVTIIGDVLLNFRAFLSDIFLGNIVESRQMLAESRKNFSFNKEGGSGIATQFKNVILVFFTIFIVTVNFKKLTKIIVIIISLFLILSSGQRWPLFEALLVYFIFRSYIKKIKINLKKIVVYGVFIYLILFITSFFQSRFVMSDNLFDNLLKNVEAINYRLFVSQAMTSYYIFDLIPETLNFGWGDYILKDFSTYLPGYQEGFATYIYKLTHGGNTGSASFSTLTLFFADFGVFSILISFFFGIAIQYYTNLIFIKKISIHRLIFHSLVVVAIATTSLGSISGIITHGLLSGYLLFVIFKLLLKPMKNKLKKLYR